MPLLLNRRFSTFPNVRQETKDGTEYYVVPVTLAKEGLMNGRGTRALYPAAVLKESAGEWEGIVITNGHPINNEGIPILYETLTEEKKSEWAIGIVINTEFDEETNSLNGEAWVDKKKASSANASLTVNLLNQKPTGVSIGIDGAIVDAGGVFNDTEYSQTLTELVPDHLAILTHTEGACSLTDGCGLLVNAQTELTSPIEDRSSESWLSRKVRNHNKKAKADNKVGIAQARKAFNLGGVVLVNQLFNSPQETGMKEPEESSKPQDVMPRTITCYLTNEASYDYIREQIYNWLRSKFPNNEELAYYNHVYELFDSSVILEIKGKTYRYSYSVDTESDLVTVDEDSAEEVTRKVEFVPVTNSKGEPKVDKATIVNQLIGTCKCKESDREALMNMSEETLIALLPKEGDNSPTPKATPVTNEATPVEAGPKAKTADEWLADAPAEIQAVFNNALAIQDERKTALVNSILGKMPEESREAAKTRFEAMSIDDLVLVNQMTGTKPSPQPAGFGGRFDLLNQGRSVVTNAAQPAKFTDEDVLEDPIGY